ncbi:MAG: sensor histidine kinase [Sandaracinaceae bacterium]
MRLRVSVGVAAVGVCSLAGAAWVLGGSPFVALVAVAALVSAALSLHHAGRRNPRLDEAVLALETRQNEAASERRAMRTRAETAGRFREEFVAAVRHELNTPLNSILGFSGVLLQEVDGPLNDAQQEDVESIRDAGAYLQELVQAVLAEWAPGRSPARRSEVCLAGLMREVARLLSGQVKGKPVHIEVVVTPERAGDDGLVLRADPRRLRQILINLGTNAIRATPRGTVTLRAERIEDATRITVRDTGRGIPEEEQAKLFEPFQQSGHRASRRGGSGLGLSLTRDMVEWHGGRIEIESELGVGTAFHLYFPRSDR